MIATKHTTVGTENLKAGGGNEKKDKEWGGGGSASVNWRFYLEFCDPFIVQ